MRIIILGAGQVGSTLATRLVKEESDITVIDTEEEKLNALRDQLDIRTIVGHASLPSVLKSAGAADAEIMIACTSSDEVNLLACQVGHHMFKIPTRIARIRELDYASHTELFTDDKISVNVLINPEGLLTEYIQASIQYPSALEVRDFADGRVKLVGIKAATGNPLVNQKVKHLREHIPNVESRVAAIYRDKNAIIPEGDTVVEPGDEVFFLTKSEHVGNVIAELRKVEKACRNVIIAGGGHIGEKLAKALQKKHRVKIIEMNSARCDELTNSLNKTVVLKGSCVDRKLLIEENIGNCDIFCAITNIDEANIMACLLAKNCGAKKTIALVNRVDYEALFTSGDYADAIDKIIEPQQITTSRLLSHVRRGDVVKVHSLRYGAAEAFEAIAHGNSKNSRIIGKRLEDIGLPHGVNLAALVRGDEVLMGHRHLVVEPEDHLIFFVVDKNSISAVEQLFAPPGAA